MVSHQKGQCLFSTFIRMRFKLSWLTMSYLFGQAYYLEFCPKIMHLKKKNQSNTFLKTMPKLMLKTIIDDYGFN